MTKNSSKSAARTVPLTRVLLFAPYGAGTHYHGAGTTFYRMYSKASHGEIRVSLLHGSPRQPIHNCYDEQVFLGNAGGGAMATAWFIRQAKRWLRARADNFDVLHAITGFYHCLAPATYAESLGLPAVVTVSSHMGDLGAKASLLSRLLRLPQKRQEMARHVSAMIATSQSIFDELRSVGVPERNIVRIPYGVDTDTFTPPSAEEKSVLRQQFGWPNRPTFVFVGELIPRKRPLLIVEAVQELVDAGFDCQAAFVGPAPNDEYAQRMRAFVQAHQLSDRVMFTGFQTSVANYYRAADVFILPSAGEGLPNAMLEAMACGLPAIGTAISGISDLIHPGKNGFIIQPTVAELTAAMKFFLVQPEHLLGHGQFSQQLIESRYSLNVVIPMYLDLFRRVAGKRSSIPSEAP